MARQDESQPAEEPQLTRLPGAPIPPPLLHQLEVTLRTDLSNVRIHSAHNAAARGAIAFTHGDNIHFQPGTFQPYSNAGQQMIMHELAHVVQQRQVGALPMPQRTFAPGSQRPAGE